MRYLSDNQMLCLLPADHQVEAQALARMVLFDRLGGDSSRLPRLKEQGILKTASINHEGKPVAMVWYRQENERLIVDTLCAVDKGRTTEEAFQSIFAGVEQLARSRGCDSIEGVTSRAALAKVYLDHGFEAKGVLLRKQLN